MDAALSTSLPSTAPTVKMPHNSALNTGAKILRHRDTLSPIPTSINPRADNTEYTIVGATIAIMAAQPSNNRINSGLCASTGIITVYGLLNHLYNGKRAYCAPPALPFYIYKSRISSRKEEIFTKNSDFEAIHALLFVKFFVKAVDSSSTINRNLRG